MAVEWRFRWVAPVLLAVTGAATVLAFVVASTRSLMLAALLGVAGAAYVGMVLAERRHGGLRIAPVASVTALACIAGVAVAPRTSGDLWMYAVYGRMAALHLDPWTHVPAALLGDPVLGWAGTRWINTPSMYGPLMVWIERTGSPLVGSSSLATRGYYQAIAVLAVTASVAVIWRHTRSAAAVAFFALNPVVLVHLVNDGRNDVLVGLAMVVAVVMVTDGHDALPGALAGAAVLVKFTAGIGGLALAAWLLVHRGPRAALRAALAATAVVGFGTALAGPASLTVPLRRAGQLISSGSPWSVMGHLHLHAPPSRLAVVVAAAITVFVLLRHLDRSPALAVAAALGVWTLALPYVLPGYLGWTLATAALERRSRVATVLAAESVVFVTGYALVRAPWWPASLDTPLHVVLPLAVLAGVVAIVTDARRPEVPVPEADHELPSTYGDDARVLVVVPTYQEVDNVTPLLTQLRAACPRADVLVVDDSSPDGTAARVDQLADALGGIRVLRRPMRGGLASAYVDGFGIAIDDGYDVVVEMDADGSHRPEELPRLLAAVADGAGLVIGSRYAAGGRTVDWSAARRVLSRVGGAYARVMLRLPVRDATSGFRAYRTEFLRAVDRDAILSRGYAFQIEMTYRALQSGARIVEIPITFHERAAGHSKMSPTIVLEALIVVTRLAFTEDRPTPARELVKP